MSFRPKIAVFGTNGLLGKPVLEALTSSTFSKYFSFPIIAITRDKSRFTSTNLIEFREANLDQSNDSFTQALKDVDVLINVASLDIQLNTLLGAIVKSSSVKLYIPTQFGMELTKIQDYLPIIDIKIKHSEKARKLGIKTVDISTGLFAVPGSFLYEWLGAVGYSRDDNVATIIGDPDLKFAISKLEDIGKSVASIVSKDPNTLPDSVRIYSDLVSQEQVLERYERSHNIKINRQYITKQQGLEKAQDTLKNGFNIKDFFFYLQVVASQGIDKGSSFSSDERDFVNPNESLFDWGKF
ncbi:uncharacterized protein ASCRUDRAFT_75604 [Ascoidea rubescens DSM 1968]|uniref:NmrA-like domain-containing protein n=1 Tax=Ascoidea rubescens DSM 1968 TaxID=1344418 RepID=A0A1D2VJ04_9ASCO|nr:hypothetical protein ASCRUDRAFT_75604 [Ascoidea rubescens DSM 1968]ODV61614.1 hypothetical protein ASCRUDRAFT_75604 [Ascoidea rubescens DSM 1968]